MNGSSDSKCEFRGLKWVVGVNRGGVETRSSPVRFLVWSSWFLHSSSKEVFNTSGSKVILKKWWHLFPHATSSARTNACLLLLAEALFCTVGFCYPWNIRWLKRNDWGQRFNTAPSSKVKRMGRHKMKEDSPDFHRLPPVVILWAQVKSQCFLPISATVLILQILRVLQYWLDLAL